MKSRAYFKVLTSFPGFDMHSVVAAATIVKLETEQGNQFTFQDLLGLLGNHF